jgi:hypothetical protein
MMKNDEKWGKFVRKSIFFGLKMVQNPLKMHRNDRKTQIH